MGEKEVFEARLIRVFLVLHETSWLQVSGALEEGVTTGAKHLNLFS